MSTEVHVCVPVQFGNAMRRVSPWEKVRQLISIAVAVTTHCDGRFIFHTDAALKTGATKQEMVEALGVAMAMNGGATLI
jgi:AhpD family alkylhydroperoxidase